MIDTALNFEKILYVIDDAIKPAYLSKIQQIILKQTWEGKTYSEIASNYNYEFDYIKSAGCELWKLLSLAFDDNITKVNFTQFIRRELNSVATLDVSSSCDAIDLETGTNEFCNWNIAPDVSQIPRYSSQIERLDEWSEDSNCHFILITGIVGCGKTTLVTQFAQEAKQKYDRVMWFSLTNLPQAEVIVKSCLKIIAPNLYANLNDLAVDFSTLLVSLVSSLREKRCLIVLDGLESIVETDSLSTYYRPGYEQYGNFFRSIIMTDNKSLLVCTSRIKPKWLSHYNSEKVRLLTLNGLDRSVSDDLLNHCFGGKNFPEQKWFNLLEYCLYNPQIINILATKIETWENEDLNDFLTEIATLDSVGFLLEKEMSYMSVLEKESIFWLAVSCSNNTVEGLRQKLSQSTSKVELLEVLKDLEQRALIVKTEDEYTLVALIKNYLQKKLVRFSLQNFEYRNLSGG